MFGLLKKKLSNFGEKLKQNLDKKEIKEETKSEEIKTKESKITPEKTISKKEIIAKEKPNIQQKEKNVETKPIIEKKDLTKETISREDKVFEEIKREIEKEDASLLEKEETDKKEILNEEDVDDEFEKEIPEEEDKEELEKKLVEQAVDREKIEIKKADEDKRELKAKIGAGGKIKGFFSGKVEIKENDIETLIWELELSLIESDVEQDTAKEITQQIQKRMIGQKIALKNLNDFLKQQIKEILSEMMKTEKINVLEEIKKNEKPYTILLIGPNGAGKTTSIAKLTQYFKKNKLSCVWAAADTFRSGAIDQLQEHADKLETKIIKQQYGADPAAVAFDAIKSAKANENDVVLIDSAGRQETNKNLMEELKKIERVAKPNLKIYVGEAYTGQGLLDMAKEFDEMIGIDGFILTKIDTDAKGGTTISLLYKLKKPIIFIGTGQNYDDFEEFDSEFILNRII